MQKALLFILFTFLFLALHAQRVEEPKTEKLPEVKKEMSRPKKATLLSIIPGGGQIYNERYWKVPVIYIGFGALTYATIANQQLYNDVRMAYQQRLKNEPVTNPEYANVPTEMLFTLREYYRKNRDLTVVSMVGLYAFNLIDAAVDAHLKEFDVSDKLSMHVKPVYQYGLAGQYTGLNLRLRF